MCPVLAEMKLTFPTAAPTVLCSALVPGKVLVTHQRVLAQHQHLLSNIPLSHTSSRLRVGKILGRDIPRTSDSHCPKGYSTL